MNTSIQQKKVLGMFVPLMLVQFVLGLLIAGVNVPFTSMGTALMSRTTSDAATVTVTANVMGSLVNLVTGSLMSLIAGGAFLAVYRALYWDQRPKGGDLFFFFNKHFVKNFLVVLVLNIAIGLGFILLIVPGIIMACGLILWPFVLRERQAAYDQGESMGIGEVFSKTWDLTRGYKGKIFGIELLYYVIAAILMVLICAPVFVLLRNASDAFVASILTAGLAGILVSIVAYVVYYLVHIRLVKELPPRCFGHQEADTWHETAPVRREAYRDNPFDTTQYPPTRDDDTHQ